eukprot:1501188-Prymnesium_polylepis.1
MRARRRHDPRCCVPARGCVVSRALLSAALCAVPRWPRYALTCAPPCAQAPIVGAAATRIQWRNGAFTRCVCLVARRAQRCTWHGL